MKKTNDDADWIYWGTPRAVTVIHRTSRAALLGHATAWNQKGHVFYLTFPYTGEYQFSDVTGMGRGRAAAWRLSEASIRLLTDDPARAMKEPAPGKPRKPRKPPAEDPRQVKIEGT